MSLKIEQKINNSQFSEIAPRIYTTGAFLVPVKVVIDGEDRYIWCVDEFRDDTYYNAIVSPNLIANNLADLLGQ